MRLIFVIGLAFALAACDAEQVDSEPPIRRISVDTAVDCKFLGPVPSRVSLGQTKETDPTTALLKVMSDVAVRGGNAFVLTYWDSNSDGATARADAYLCP